MTLAQTKDLILAAASSWMEDRAPRLGAALAYYTVFSLAPVLVIAIAVAGLIFGEDAARGEVAHQIESLVGQQGSQAIQEMLAGASIRESGLKATLISVGLLLFGSIVVFGELQDSLNQIWNVPDKPSSGWWKLVRDRLWSFVMVLAIALLLLALLVSSAVLSAVLGWLDDWPTAWLAIVLDTLLSLAVLTGLFAMIYKILPDTRIDWRDVWLGAVITALLFLGGRYLIGLYLGRGTLGSAYGAAGSFAALLIWLYYSAQVFLFGAELTHQYACKYGSSQHRLDC